MTDINTAFLKAQQDCKPLIANKSNQHYKSKYADLAAVLAACGKALRDNGFHITQEVISPAAPPDVVVNSSSGKSVFSLSAPYTLITTFTYGASGALSFEYPVYVSPHHNIHMAVGVGVTYARRFALLGALGIASEDEEAPPIDVTPKKKTTAKPKTTKPANDDDDIDMNDKADYSRVIARALFDADLIKENDVPYDDVAAIIKSKEQSVQLRMNHYAKKKDVNILSSYALKIIRQWKGENDGC